MGDTPFDEGFEDEVDVIGHEAEGVDADAVAAGEAIEMVEVGDELGAGAEDGLLAAAALVDVVDLAHLPVALARRGGGELCFFWGKGGHLLISGFSEGKFSLIFQETCGKVKPSPRQWALKESYFPLIDTLQSLCCLVGQAQEQDKYKKCKGRKG